MLARLLGALVLATLVLFGGPGAAGAEEPKAPKGRRDFVFEQVWVDPVRDLAPDARRGGGTGISNIIFVNRCPGNCIITPGNDDARLDTSSIPDSTSTITEFALGDEVYDQVIECLRDVYSPYDVEIVTEDPGEGTFHHEAILAGEPQELGRAANVGGIAPSNCEPLNNVITFSFANALGSDVETLCWTVAQESAHAFGLPNHVYDCLDPMTYLEGPCGRKYFRNRSIQCGEFAPGDCRCGGSAQNSHRELVATFGEGTPPAPPEVTLLYPEADDVVADNFDIFFTAIDPRLVHHVDVYLNGVRYLTVDGHAFENRADDYAVEAPDHPDGYIDIEIRAYNEINEEAGVARTTVLKGEPCDSADDCFEFMDCSAGHCAYPAPAGELGDECAYDEYCLDGPCIEGGGERRCSQECPVGVSDSCPGGYECLSPGFCWPSDSGGCCTVAGGQGSDDRFPLAVLSVFAGAMLVLRRRAGRARRARRVVGSPRSPV
jgi:hypothetical protein